MSALPLKADLHPAEKLKKKSELSNVNCQLQGPDLVDRCAYGASHVECLTTPFGDVDFAIASNA
jgi:hypothetical protein